MFHHNSVIRRCWLAALLIALVSLAGGCGDDDGANQNNNDNAAPVCGNGAVEDGEQCDDGAANSDITPDTCRSNCRSPHCGDGVQDSGEACDGAAPANTTCTDAGDFTGGTLGCASDCTLDTEACTRCGDGVREGTEACDGTDLDGQNCASLNAGQHGVLVCAANCTFDASACHTCGDATVEAPAEACEPSLTLPTCQDQGYSGGQRICLNDCQILDTCTSLCGNGVAEPDEECDGNDLGGMTCADIDSQLVGGSLRCSPGCKLDASQCTRCGNGQIDTGEECDGQSLGSATCGSLVGVPVCGATCRVDYATCVAGPECGNGVIDTSEGEQCDGLLLGIATCASVSTAYSGGMLTCGANCLYDTSGCKFSSTCGNGTVDAQAGEDCDGADLGGANCQSLGYPGGTLGCTAQCTHDTSGCSAPTTCGNGAIDGVGEQCDGAALGGQTCVTAGYADGTLGCTTQCSLDLSGCTLCGNGVQDPGEECDGSDHGDQTCITQGLAGGQLACTAQCTFDTGGCTSLPSPVLANYLITPSPVNGLLYYFGGTRADNPGSEPFQDHVYSYDVDTGTWLDLGAVLPYGLDASYGQNATLADNGKIYLGPQLGPTGSGGWGSHNQIIEFDPTTGTAIERAALHSSAIWNVEAVSGGNSYVYFFGGWTGSVVHKVWRYDPATDTVTDLGNLLSGHVPSNGNVSGLLADDGLIYLFIGWNTNKVITFDPATETIDDPTISLPTADHGYSVFPGPTGKIHLRGFRDTATYTLDTPTGSVTANGNIAPLPLWSGYDQAFRGARDPVSEQVFVYGGGATQTDRTTMRIFGDVAGTPTAAPVLANYMSHPETVGGKIYYFGGTQADDPGSEAFKDTVYVYDVSQGTWEARGSVLPYGITCGCGQNAAYASNGKFYLGPQMGPTSAGGWGSHNQIIEYDPATNIATERAALLGSNVWLVEAIDGGNGNVYFFGGWTGSVVYKVWRYVPTTNTVTDLGNLLSGHVPSNGNVSGVLLDDGLIYLFIGWNTNKVITFNPSTETIEDPSITLPTSNHGYTVFPGGASTGTIHFRSFQGTNTYTLTVGTGVSAANSALGPLPTWSGYDQAFRGVRDYATSQIFIHGGGGTTTARETMRIFND